MSRPAPSSTQRLWSLIVAGLTLQIIGFLIAGLNAPHVEVTRQGWTLEGDRGMLLVGLLTFGLGGVLSLIAVVGFGVLLGLRARAEDPAGSPSPVP